MLNYVYILPKTIVFYGLCWKILWNTCIFKLLVVILPCLWECFGWFIELFPARRYWGQDRRSEIDGWDLIINWSKHRHHEKAIESSMLLLAAILMLPGVFCCVHMLHAFHWFEKEIGKLHGFPQVLNNFFISEVLEVRHCRCIRAHLLFNWKEINGTQHTAQSQGNSCW